MGALDGLKSKITYENKTIIGVVGIVLAIFFWILAPSIGFLGALISVLPAILLIIPSPTVKNSKALAIITGIILLIWLIAGISHFMMVIYDYMPMSMLYEPGYVETMYVADILEIILVIYGLICAFILAIPTEPKGGLTTTNTPSNNNAEVKYDKYCSKCGTGLKNDAKFRSSCGSEID